MMQYFVDTNGNYLGGHNRRKLSKFEVPYPPENTKDVWDFNAKAYVLFVEEKPLNDVMEAAFLSILPTHLRQSYLTDSVIRDIMTAKQAVRDANELGLFDVSKSIIKALSLPTEMETDRTTLMNMIPGGE